MDRAICCNSKLADSPCAIKEIQEAARLGHSIPKVRDDLTVDSVGFRCHRPGYFTGSPWLAQRWFNVW
ncbi:MAG: hypothetical protein KF760_26955 [Candidatus Eremiobacteraeota bacterium]|nr:hypothetical protein [Candidatus Eremiobacteraeota bacterium]MCW5869620.1 hypothetical protein [Candidatus Eremiobacteraeota bacterium]